MSNILLRNYVHLLVNTNSPRGHTPLVNMWGVDCKSLEQIVIRWVWGGLHVGLKEYVFTHVTVERFNCVKCSFHFNCLLHYSKYLECLIQCKLQSVKINSARCRVMLSDKTTKKNNHSIISLITLYMFPCLCTCISWVPVEWFLVNVFILIRNGWSLEESFLFLTTAVVLMNCLSRWKHMLLSDNITSWLQLIMER